MCTTRRGEPAWEAGRPSLCGMLDCEAHRGSPSAPRNPSAGVPPDPSPAGHTLAQFRGAHFLRDAQHAMPVEVVAPRHALGTGLA